MSRLLRHFGALAAGTIAAASVACSGMEEPATTDCDAQGSVCTGDGRLELTVSGPSG